MDTNTILASLSASYGLFILKYHMNNMHKKLTELHGILKTTERDIKKGAHQVLMAQNKAKFNKSYWAKKKAKAKGKDNDMILQPLCLC